MTRLLDGASQIDRELSDKKELVAVIPMELSKAFDNIPHSLLLAKLQAYGLDTVVCTLFVDLYLRNRMQRVKVGDTFYAWQAVGRGIPRKKC